jgi:N-terminal region of glycosyl transferase group 7
MSLGPRASAVLVFQAQGRDFDIVVVEQADRLRFNRGALLNAGVLLLQVC